MGSVVLTPDLGETVCGVGRVLFVILSYSVNNMRSGTK